MLEAQVTSNCTLYSIPIVKAYLRTFLSLVDDLIVVLEYVVARERH